MNAIGDCGRLAVLEDLTCYMEKNGTEGNITRSDIDEELVELTKFHKENLDCLWFIEVEPEWKVTFLFLFVFNLNDK